MTLRLRAEPGNWGRAQVADVEAVASSAAAAFAVIDDDESMAIVLKPRAREDDPPMTEPATTPSGAFVIWLNVRGNLWARLAYQFAHELCHVLAGPRTWRNWTNDYDPFAWVEEALCETASLFALCSMAKRWAIEPPYPQWRDYSSALAEYEAEWTSGVARRLPPGRRFSSWLPDHLPDLEAHPDRRDDNTIVAKELLPIFETDRAAWRAVRWLHTWPRSSEATLADFMTGWARACPEEYHPVVESIAVLFGVATDR